MIKKLSDFICGYRYITVCPEAASHALDLMYRKKLYFTSLENLDDGSIKIKIKQKYARHFIYLAEKESIPYLTSDIHGFPLLGRFIKKRPAAVIGAVIFFAWLFYSSHIVWDIRIEGNSKTSDSEIISLLDELGFGIGTNFSKVDFNDLHAKYSAAQHDIAWLSVYMNGTVAEIQVRELWKDEREKHGKNTYANVVADCDGVVKEINVFEGQAAVKRGDTVRCGQVLISGVVEKKDGGYRCEYAAGEVICETAEPIHVEVNTECEEKSYTGREKIKESIKFFKKTVNLFKNYGIEYTKYDKINKVEQLCPLGLCKIPVWVEKNVYKEFEYEKTVITAKEAADRAMALLSEKVKEASRSGELVSKTTDKYFTDGLYNIDCLLYITKDIGITKEFTAEDIP